jgi:hypothetical protein
MYCCYSRTGKRTRDPHLYRYLSYPHHLPHSLGWLAWKCMSAFALECLHQRKSCGVSRSLPQSFPISLLLSVWQTAALGCGHTPSTPLHEVKVHMQREISKRKLVLFMRRATKHHATKHGPRSLSVVLVQTVHVHGFSARSEYYSTPHPDQ